MRTQDTMDAFNISFELQSSHEEITWFTSILSFLLPAPSPSFSLSLSPYSSSIYYSHPPPHHLSILLPYVHRAGPGTALERHRVSSILHGRSTDGIINPIRWWSMILTFFLTSKPREQPIEAKHEMRIDYFGTTPRKTC